MFRSVLVLSLLSAPAWSAPYIPREVLVPGMNPAETSAARIWNMRAALNVAALQCQYSPFLRTVDRYNGVLKQHAKELETARLALDKFFKRTGGPKEGALGFDRYNTRVYQSYATMDAQVPFCLAASEAARTAALQPIGKLATVADAQVGVIRTAMTPVFVDMAPLKYFAFNALSVCQDRRGRQFGC